MFLKRIFNKRKIVQISLHLTFNLGRRGASEAIKSDFARNKIKSISRQYLDELADSTTNSLSKTIAGKGVGRGVDIHKAVGKLPKPKSGWTLPGHKYTGPYNDLEKQFRYDKDTGEILEIYDSPTGKTDAIAMQHDVDCSVCGDDKECKHRVDKKIVRALDAVPWKERQWGHWLARNAINAKRKEIGDTVRISKYKRKTFDKGYTPNWTEEVFIIDDIRPTDPITYKIKYLNGEEIKGTIQPYLLKRSKTIKRYL